MTLPSVVVLSPKSQDRCDKTKDLASLCYIDCKNQGNRRKNSVKQLIWEEDPHPKAIFFAWKLKGKEAHKEGKRGLMGTFPQVGVFD